MGGIHTDKNGKTSMENLYAAGETACNGVHGANRLASNSLLESLIFAKRAADEIVADISNDVDASTTDNVNMSGLDLNRYNDIQAWQSENRQLIMNEIKRKDEEFYVKWCNNED